SWGERADQTGIVPSPDYVQRHVIVHDAVLTCLRCAVCHGPLNWQAYCRRRPDQIERGVAWCTVCHSWFPIEDGLLELLPPALAYGEDRRRFWAAHAGQLRGLGLGPFHEDACTRAGPQRKQQRHFDWYASNDQQTYAAYEQMPFWRAVDARVFSEWRG